MKAYEHRLGDRRPDDAKTISRHLKRMYLPHVASHEAQLTCFHATQHFFSKVPVLTDYFMLLASCQHLKETTSDKCNESGVPLPYSCVGVVLAWKNAPGDKAISSSLGAKCSLWTHTIDNLNLKILKVLDGAL